MTIAILYTGDELIHGDTLNTNSYAISQALSSEGLSIGLQMTCSDKDKDIQDSINFLIKDHDIVIITGGLGPTSDDRTRFAFEKLFGITLVEFPEALLHVKDKLSNRRQLHSGDAQQALFPPNATILFNPYGTAMGCHFTVENKLFFLLPGPPRECMPMFHHHVIPFLRKQQHSTKTILKWLVFGVPESLIANDLDKALLGLDCKTGYRYDSPYVELKVRCKPALVETVNAIVEPIVNPYVISSSNKKASAELAENIAEVKIPISIIDEATGGILQTLIQRPNNYRYLSFSSTSREKSQLNVRISGFQAYWKDNKDHGQAEIVLSYSKDQGPVGEERRKFPLHSNNILVLNAAAEWLCFRIANLINPLH